MLPNLPNPLMVDSHTDVRKLAESANRGQDNFYANISHEIRTLLTSITELADLLAGMAQTTGNQKKIIARIRHDAEHLLALTNDILDISKNEANTLILDPRKCCLTAVIAEITTGLREQATDRGLTLAVEYTTEIPQTILADEMRLRQILLNLIRNAIKFTNTGGIKVVTTFLPRWRQGEPGVKIEIIDTGIGIAPEELPQLYQPFAGVEPVSSQSLEWSGHGLAISKRLAELMGGNLAVDSQLGKGTCVIVTLPTGPLDGVEMLAYPGESTMRRKAPEETSAAKKLSGIEILLAEDSPEIQRLLGAILTKAGVKVATADNGVSALEKAGEKKFDVILMDMQMPQKDGYETTASLRELGCTAPVIALTAQARVDDWEKCLAAGCNDYLSKPVDGQHLLEVISKHTMAPPVAAPTPKESLPGRNNYEIPEAIPSAYAADPEIAELLDNFIAELEPRIETMWNTLTDKRYRQIQRMAHQLKGAGGLYGYPVLTDLAGILEDKIIAGDINAARQTLCKLNLASQAILRTYRENKTPDSAGIKAGRG